MPYSGEVANKTSHIDIVRNPEVAEFISRCKYLAVPSDEEGLAINALFQRPTRVGKGHLPSRIIAVDGSYYESSIDDRWPSTKVGYVRIGSILIDLQQFDSLRVRGGRFVDPFRMAALRDNNSPLTFVFPSANLRLGDRNSVRDSFREVLDKKLDELRVVPTDPSTSLRATLFHLAARRTGDLATGDLARLRIHKCPTCGEPGVEVADIPDPQFCPHCQEQVFPSDCLRVWEEVTEFQSNALALARVMQIIEHLLPVHYVRYLFERSPQALAGLAFFIDGPLAVFGNAAWLHGPVMNYYHEVNSYLERRGYPRILVIGLQKSGLVVEHAMMIDRYIESDRLYSIDDEYRYRYIYAGREPAANGFGAETYYGQDFILKTRSGKIFVFGIPYPFASKFEPEIEFKTVKSDITRYSDLSRAVSAIEHFESDLYYNAVIPIALAHRYTAISLVPGSRVLDLLTKQALPPTDGD